MPGEEKLFYTIGEVAQLLNVKPYVLRYWESEFKKLNPQKSVTGQRTYRKKDIQVALVIKKLLYEDKYTIAGALVKLDEIDRDGFEGIVVPLLSEASDVNEKVPVTDDNIPAEKTKTDIEPVQNPSRSPEKTSELISLISSTNAILKKYHLA